MQFGVPSMALQRDRQVLEMLRNLTPQTRRLSRHTISPATMLLANVSLLACRFHFTSLINRVRST